MLSETYTASRFLTYEPHLCALASTRPGGRMPGTHPQYFGWGDVNGNIPQHY